MINSRKNLNFLVTSFLDYLENKNKLSENIFQNQKKKIAELLTKKPLTVINKTSSDSEIL